MQFSKNYQLAYFPVTLNCQTSQQLIHLNGDHSKTHKTCVINNAHLTDLSEEVTISGISHGDTSMVGVMFRNSVVKFFPKEFLKAFPNLQVIDLQDQHVDDVYRDNFVGGSSHIRTYWAPNNEITKLGPNAFSYMGFMYTLYLENNPIEFIHALAFSGLPKLKILFLKGTNMKSLSYESFWFLFDLNWVNFQNANGRSNCMNQEFDSLNGDLAPILRKMEQSCSSGDPFKVAVCDIKEIEALKSANKKYQVEIEAFVLKVAEKDNQIAQLKEEIKSSKSAHLLEINTIMMQVQQKEEEIKNKVKEIAVKDLDITEKVNVITTKETEITGLNTVIDEKDKKIAEKEEIIDKKDLKIAEKDRIITEKDNIIEEKDKKIVSKDAEIVALKNMIKEQKSKMVNE